MQRGVGAAASSPTASRAGLQGGSSSKGALFLLSPPGKKGSLGRAALALGRSEGLGSDCVCVAHLTCPQLPPAASPSPAGSQQPEALAFPQLSAPCWCFSAAQGRSWHWWCLCCSHLGVSVSVTPLLVFSASVAQLCLWIKYGITGLVKFSGDLPLAEGAATSLCLMSL